MLIRNSNHICVPFNECMKKGTFQWTTVARDSFEYLKIKVTGQPIFSLPDFNKAFQVDCDASGTTIGVVLTQEGRPISFFNEKLNVAREKYFVYDQ
jgi:hypothetical protein